MKNNHISNLSKWAMIVAAMILQISCQQDDSFSPAADSTIVNLSVSAADAGTTTDNDGSASAIKSLCILQFNANGDAFGTLRHVGIGTETIPNSGKYSATLLQSVDDNDKYKLVILANFPDGNYGIFYRMGGKSYAEVQQACLSAELAGETTVLEFTDQQPFPMFGIAKDGTPQIIDATMDLGTVSLVRAVARVDIGIGTKNSDNTWTKGGVPFTMTQVQIWKDGKQYAYMPAENNFSSSAGVLAINSPSPVGSTETKIYGSTYIANTTYCAEKIYLPEANLSWGSVFDDNHTNRLAIIVGGRYNSSQTETFYRVDFTYDEGSMGKMNILRNHVYQFTIKKVEAAGYASAEIAYNSKPKGLGFNATVEQWTDGQTTSVPSIQGYYLSYQGFNGENVLWTYAAGLPPQKIPVKKSYWGTNTYLPFDYNNFYKEGNSFYSPDILGGQNGSLYNTVGGALSYEGTFPSLMVSGDDMLDDSGSDAIPWKDGTTLTLTAFDLCRTLEEGGYDNWRLPRLSELAFIYLNQESLQALRGYTSLSGSYWCGSEYLINGASEEQQKKSDYAWAVDFTDGSGYASWHEKAEKLKIRCVRQASDTKSLKR